MGVTTNCLVEVTQLPAVETNVYTSAARTIIDKCAAYGVAAADLTVRIVPSGGTAGATHALAKKTFGVGEAYTFPEIVGHTLEPGDFISVLASAATAINLRISGRKVT